MVTLSVCVEMFWPDTPFEQRIGLAAQLGFNAFEFWGWENKDIPKIKAAMAEHDIALAVMGASPGSSLIKRNVQTELVEGMERTAQVAHELNCRTLIATVGNTIDDETYEMSRRRVVRNLRAIGEVAQREGLTLVLETLNTLVDHHGYWLTKMSQAVDIVREVDLPSVKILMDIYHLQIMEGHIISNLTQFIDEIGHFHVAGVPGRHELVGGELDYRYIFDAIDKTDYAGYVGLEYRPAMEDTEASLRQALSLA